MPKYVADVGIESLRTELLAMIFKHVLAAVPESLCLRLVCRQWNDIVTSIRCTISVALHTPAWPILALHIPHLRKHVQTRVQRAPGAMLDVRITVYDSPFLPPDESCLEVVKLLAGDHGEIMLRWQSFSVRMETSYVEPWLRSLSLIHHPVLSNHCLHDIDRPETVKPVHRSSMSTAREAYLSLLPPAAGWTCLYTLRPIRGPVNMCLLAPRADLGEQDGDGNPEVAVLLSMISMHKLTNDACSRTCGTKLSGLLDPNGTEEDRTMRQRLGRDLEELELLRSRQLAAVDIRQGRKVARGWYGEVFRAVHKPTNTVMAKKHIWVDRPARSDEILENVKKWHAYRHPNLVSFYASCINGSEVHIYMEWMGEGSLDEMLKIGTRFTFAFLRDTAAGILSCLDFLHCRGVCHGYIRPSNLLMNMRGEVKLSDLFVPDRSADINDWTFRSEALRGCLYYSPERLTNPKAPMTSQGDIWALGMTLLELATERFPTPSIDFLRDPPKEPKILTTIKCPTEMRSFLKSCLPKTPASQVDATTLLRHPWILSEPPEFALFEGVSEIGK